LSDCECVVKLTFTSSENEGPKLSVIPDTTIPVTGTGVREYRLDQTGLPPNRHYTVNTTINMDGRRTVITTQNICECFTYR